MIELNGDNLGVAGASSGSVDISYASPGRKHFISLTRDDVNRLEPGILLNDSLVDFFTRW